LVKAGDPARAIPVYKDAIRAQAVSCRGAGLGNAFDKSGDQRRRSRRFEKPRDGRRRTPRHGGGWETEMKLGRAQEPRRRCANHSTWIRRPRKHIMRLRRCWSANPPGPNPHFGKPSASAGLLGGANESRDCIIPGESAGRSRQSIPIGDTVPSRLCARPL